jgi:hypothetical protein
MEQQVTKMETFVSQRSAEPIRQCDRCVFRLQGKSACVAFPWGIPPEIREGRFDHRQPHPGDGGFRFTPQR